MMSYTNLSPFLGDYALQTTPYFLKRASLKYIDKISYEI
jgi:hypothetical protein